MKTPDDNDRLQAGTLPADPMADTEIVRPLEQPDTRADGLGRPLAELLDEAYAAFLRRFKREDTPITLPWESVNLALGGGLWPGLHVFVGGTGAGKTQFMLDVALKAARAGTPVLYVALEATPNELIARLIGLLEDTHWSGIYLGQRANVAALLETHRATLEALPFEPLFPAAHGWNYDALGTAVDALIQTYPGHPPLVVIDYLQLISSQRGEDLRERIGRAAYVCRGVARQYDATVIACSSTSRENYGAIGGRKASAETEALGQGAPSRLVGTGKETGEIEYAADSVLVLAQEAWTNNEPPAGGTVCHLALAKVRAGRPSWVKLHFDGNRFSERAFGEHKQTNKRTVVV